MELILNCIKYILLLSIFFFFFFNDTATTEIYTLSLHDALPILPSEFSDPQWSSILCMGRWDCSYRYVYDNFADPMHACYLHADSFTLAFGAKQDRKSTRLNSSH